MNRNQIFIVVPCFNEANRLNIDYWSEVAAIDHIALIFVDDGSTDGTKELLHALSAKTGCRVISLRTNVGKANAIRSGFIEILKDHTIIYMGFLDADGAFSIREIKRFTSMWLAEIENNQFSTLWASRVAMAGRNIVRNPTRHYVGRILSTLIMFKSPSIAYDTQCGFKIFTATEAFKTALESTFETRWFFDLELYVRIKQIEPEYKIYEEPLTSWHDVSGSKVRKSQFLKILLDAWAIRKSISKIH